MTRAGMDIHRVWSPELAERPADARTIEAESPEAAAVIAHRELAEHAGASVETIYCVETRGQRRWVTVAPVVTYAARPVAARCDVCGAVATHDVHNDPYASRTVCEVHSRSYWPHQTPMRADYATPRVSQ